MAALNTTVAEAVDIPSVEANTAVVEENTAAVEADTVAAWEAEEDMVEAAVMATNRRWREKTNASTNRR
jgi:hypothetical protein